MNKILNNTPELQILKADQSREQNHSQLQLNTTPVVKQ